MERGMSYCDCGHREREHDRVYSWAPGRAYCSGHVVAVDADSEGEPCAERHANCQCTGFQEADDWQLREWADLGQICDAGATA